MEERTVTVVLDRSGVLACGPYLAGIPYEVSEEEAKRLIAVKGFKLHAEASAVIELGEESRED